MPDYKARYKTQIQMNITSMIDVVFMLLIIFMIAAPLMRAEVDVNLPKSAAARSKEETTLTVTVTEGGEIFIGETPVKLEDFPTEIERLARTTDLAAVSLKGDREINYGLIMEVVGHIKEAGIENLGLVATPDTRR